MAIQAKETEILKLFDRVYNNKMIETDEINDAEDLKAYCKKVFGDGSFNPDPSAIHQFNNLIVKKADEIAKPIMTDIVGLLANHQTEKRDTVVKYTLPQKVRSRFVWSATAVGVDLIRTAKKREEVAIPVTFSTGFYYEPEDLVKDSVITFNKLVDDLANAKVRLFLREINKLIGTAITSQKIPTVNVIVGANILLAQYNYIASTLGRYGGRPLFVADTLMIDKIAQQQAVTPGISNLLTDKYKSELLQALNITSIGRTNAMNLVNPFINEDNAATELPVNIGYMLAGEGNLKPFRIVEYGGMRQTSHVDFETERVMMKVFQTASINLVFPSVLGYIKDESIVLGTDPQDITGDLISTDVLDVIELIRVLPEAEYVNTENKTAVTTAAGDARDAYDDLSDSEKAEINSVLYGKLVDVEAALAALA